MDVFPLIKQSIALQGGGAVEDYDFGPALCTCGQAMPSEGQEAYRAMATATGVYFHVKLCCQRCEGTLGVIEVTR